jgi:hypothetical protein
MNNSLHLVGNINLGGLVNRLEPDSAGKDLHQTSLIFTSCEPLTVFDFLKRSLKEFG